MDRTNRQSPLVHAESVLRMLSEPILVLDRTLGAALVNAAFTDLLQLSPDALDGKVLTDLLDATDLPQLRAILEKVLAHEGDLDREEIACTIPPGIHKTLSVSARRMGEDDANARMVLVELRDITSEKEKSDKLEELNRALTFHGSELERINSDLESFNHWVSHDLRTPLRFVNTVAHRLMEKHNETLTDDAKTSLQLILDSTSEMGRLIENLLAFVQIGRVPVKKRRINMVRLVRETLAELQEAQKDRQLEIRVDDLPPCLADRALLKQVLFNLLANALAFTRLCERAEIQVGFLRDDTSTVYFVRDNGIGFEAARAGEVFSQFRRVNTGQQLQGTGVGLTLVKRIIDRHGGRIWAEGEPSRGATFYFQIDT